MYHRLPPKNKNGSKVLSLLPQIPFITIQAKPTSLAHLTGAHLARTASQEIARAVTGHLFNQ